METTIKANFNFVIRNLENKEIINPDGPANAGKMLARIFSSMTQGDIYKLMEWARKCWEGKDIELNVKEQQEFKDYVEKNDLLTVISKEQILNELNGVNKNKQIADQANHGNSNSMLKKTDYYPNDLREKTDY
jgi:hypothetical protein